MANPTPTILVIFGLARITWPNLEAVVLMFSPSVESWSPIVPRLLLSSCAYEFMSLAMFLNAETLFASRWNCVSFSCSIWDALDMLFIDKYKEKRPDTLLSSAGQPIELIQRISITIT